MKLRDLIKCNGPNDGTRSLYESILAPEVISAISDWKREVGLKGILIGGLALSYYVKPRFTSDCDILFVSDKIPDFVEGFKRTRPGAFMHKKTHVEIEVLTPNSINLNHTLALEIEQSAFTEDGMLVASRAGLIASKLGRFNLQDRADIAALLELGDLTLSEFTLSDVERQKLQSIRDYLKE